MKVQASETKWSFLEIGVVNDGVSCGVRLSVGKKDDALDRGGIWEIGRMVFRSPTRQSKGERQLGASSDSNSEKIVPIPQQAVPEHEPMKGGGDARLVSKNCFEFVDGRMGVKGDGLVPSTEHSDKHLDVVM